MVQGKAPLRVEFHGSAIDSGSEVLNFTWILGDGSEAPGSNLTHTYEREGLYEARLAVSDSTSTTLSDPIRIQVGIPPIATIVSPINESTFRAGDAINFIGDAFDSDGTLAEESYRWTIEFLHNEHTHPELTLEGRSSGFLDIPLSGHDFHDETGYKIELAVKDSDGLIDATSISILPEKVDLCFSTSLHGLVLTVDGIPRTTPFVYDSLVDFEHSVTAPETHVQRKH